MAEAREVRHDEIRVSEYPSIRAGPCRPDLLAKCSRQQAVGGTRYAVRGEDVGPGRVG